MYPTLREGLSVLYKPTSDIKINEIVLLYHPQVTELVLIKRCVKKEEQFFWVEGDNPEESTDSRHFGWIPKDKYIGTVTSIL